MRLAGARSAFALLALAACAPVHAPLPTAPVAAGDRIAVTAIAVPLNPQDLAQNRIGDFHYAGGLALTSPDTARFHGLSDMEISADGRLSAISDEGDLLSARLSFDSKGRPIGLTDTALTVLSDLDGKPLQGKLEADAEGMTLLANGDRLVSFEQRHRIWLYPAAGGLPRAVPSPETQFPANGGMEALSAVPSLGPDVYVAAGEDSGETWTCRLSDGCVQGPTIAKPAEFGVVAVRPLPGGRMAWLLRAWDPVRGSRNSLQIHGPGGEIARLDMARPLTVDNYEALAAIPRKDGSVRFYLLSDDNFQSSQRTLLLAFDWKPSK
ncbi:MAG: esterase-like activity of phytase family protein [Pseudomonadota bacterium]|uniref:esterase-like activity of phytase family protein n=1 Tax=Phenylobacterium sp. TaxID=1871053 RepID=UPI0025D00398|nr:esterase-like activity of phytase family protein [Phenylobacterium sp.]MBT9470257.1 esterase-like activity of phytase family protein [Phenylobacterium sp.]